jgi:hypothetical protein
LRTSGSGIASYIEHFSLESETTSVCERGLIIELASRIFRVCDVSQYQHHVPHVVLFEEGGSIVRFENVIAPTSRVAATGRTERHFINKRTPRQSFETLNRIGASAVLQMVKPVWERSDV